MGENVHLNFGFLQICIFPGMELLNHIVLPFLFFNESPYYFSLVAVSVYIPTDILEEFPFLHTLSSIFAGRFFHDGHSDRCEVILHCRFDFNFSDNY